MIKKTTRQVFTCTDGREFLLEKDAREHEFWIVLEQLLDDIGVCQGGEWSAEMVMRAMKDNHEEFKAVFNIL